MKKVKENQRKAKVAPRKVEPMPSCFRVRVNWNKDEHYGFIFTDPKPVVMQYRSGIQPDAPLTRKADIFAFFDARMHSNKALFFFPQFVCICGRVYMREDDTSRSVTVAYVDITDDARYYTEGFDAYMEGLKECGNVLEKAAKRKVKNLR